MILTNKVLSKTKVAFLLSVEKLFEEHDEVFFWTFTFESVEPDFRAMWLWNQFMKRLLKFFGGYAPGLRVVEVHPGGGPFQLSHGLHFHALIARHLNIHIVKRLAKPWGFGRITVKKADRGSGLYLAKYLTKENDVAPGVRRWGTIGGFRQFKSNNIECDSPLTRNIRWIQDKIQVKQFGHAFFIYVSQQTMKYGHIDNWPTLRCVTKNKAWAPTVKDVEADDDGQYYEVKRSEWEPTRLRVKDGSKWKEVDQTGKPF